MSTQTAGQLLAREARVLLGIEDGEHTSVRLTTVMLICTPVVLMSNSLFIANLVVGTLLLVWLAALICVYHGIENNDPAFISDAAVRKARPDVDTPYASMVVVVLLVWIVTFIFTAQWAYLAWYLLCFFLGGAIGNKYLSMYNERNLGEEDLDNAIASALDKVRSSVRGSKDVES